MLAAAPRVGLGVRYGQLGGTSEKMIGESRTPSFSQLRRRMGGLDVGTNQGGTITVSDQKHSRILAADAAGLKQHNRGEWMGTKWRVKRGFDTTTAGSGPVSRPDGRRCAGTAPAGDIQRGLATSGWAGRCAIREAEMQIGDPSGCLNGVSDQEAAMFDADWAPVILEVAAIVGGLVFYVGNWRARDRLRKIRLANMLFTELTSIRDAIEHIKKNDYREDSMVRLPNNVYDGLVASANISYFGMDVQGPLHCLYRYIGTYNDDAPYGGGVGREQLGAFWHIATFIEPARSAVVEFRRHNTPNKRWLPVMRAIRWYYDD